MYFDSRYFSCFEKSSHNTSEKYIQMKGIRDRLRVPVWDSESYKVEKTRKVAELLKYLRNNKLD